MNKGYLLPWQDKIYVIAHTHVQVLRWCHDNGLTSKDVVDASPQALRGLDNHHHCIVLLNMYWLNPLWDGNFMLAEMVHMYRQYQRCPVFRINDDE